MRGTVLIQATEHRGTFLLPFFAKRKRAGERLQAVPAREKIKGRGSAPGHGRMSSTERLAGQGSGHCPPRTPPRGEGVYVFGNIFCLARPALYRAGLFIAGAYAIVGNIKKAHKGFYRIMDNT